MASIDRGTGAPRRGPSRLPRELGQRAWRAFCRGVVKVFYRRCEAQGRERIPIAGPVLLCANHANALADGVIVQAVCPRPIHPLARSGLFRNPLLRPLLALLGAVSIYRPEDPGSDPERNVDSFAHCYELLSRGAALLIFPEGQSHSDPRLRPLRTGAARLARGAVEAAAVRPTVLPIGLTFTQKGKFRSDVLVQVGEPVDIRRRPGEEPEETVRRLTGAIGEGLARVTLNVDSWEDLKLLRSLRRFFLLRRGRGRRRSLFHRFRALARLIETHRQLRRDHPEQVADLTKRLRRFERLCHRYGVRDYHLTIRYTPAVVSRFVLRSLSFLAVVFPLALWGTANSIAPFLLTRHLSRRFARGPDQYDTAKILLGLVLFSLFWGGQVAAVFWLSGRLPAALYAASLPVTAATALALRRERARILENVRVFFLFTRGSELREYLLEKRRGLERDLARLVREAARAEAGPDRKRS